MLTPTQLDAVKTEHRYVWELGNYHEVAARQLPIARTLCQWAGVSPGTRVLDIGTATGNVAITAASLGATVDAIDITPAMIDKAQARAASERADVTFRVGDAEDLSFPPATFDFVLSACGAWFAPRPEVVVAETKRVLQPGGVVAFANFTPGGYMGAVNTLITQRIPLPGDVPEPNLWGHEDIARERLAAFANVSFATRTNVYEFASAHEATKFWLAYSPPHVAAAKRLPPNSSAELTKEIQTYTESEWSDGGRIRIEAEYLLVRAEREEGYECEA